MPTGFQSPSERMKPSLYFTCFGAEDKCRPSPWIGARRTTELNGTEHHAFGADNSSVVALETKPAQHYCGATLNLAFLIV
jgi:hypothetical protein